MGLAQNSRTVWVYLLKAQAQARSLVSGLGPTQNTKEVERSFQDEGKD
jgi:hypothetical protein